MNENQRKPLNSTSSGALLQPSSGEDTTNLQARLAGKRLWKSQVGHRYTPEELKRMSEVAEVQIHRRKRVVMQLP